MLASESVNLEIFILFAVFTITIQSLILISKIEYGKQSYFEEMEAYLKGAIIQVESKAMNY